MKTWKRAFLYLIRKKTRSILLVLILFVMAIFIVVGNAMRTSTMQQIDKIRRNLGTSFTVAADTQNESLYEEYVSDGENLGYIFSGKRLTPQLVGEIEKVEGIVDYEINKYTIVSTNLNLRGGTYENAEPHEYMDAETLDIYRHSTLAIFCGNGDMNVNFRTGAFSISDGRNILKEDRSSVIISEYLAKKNVLSVGDTIVLESKRGIFEINSENPGEVFGDPLEVKIVGIFSVNFEQEASVYTPESQYAENFLYIDQYTGAQLKQNESELFGEDDQYRAVTFFVENPEELESVMNQVMETIDLSGLKVSLDDSAYSASIKPLRQINTFAIILIICGSIGCAVIFYLILSLWIKGRIREIGILISVGVGKRKIIWQMMLECTAIATIALLIALISAVPIANLFFHAATELTTSQKNQESFTTEVELGEALPTITKISSEKVELSYETSVKDYIVLIVITYAITSLSVLAASVQILKVSPKTLLQSG